MADVTNLGVFQTQTTGHEPEFNPNVRQSEILSTLGRPPVLEGITVYTETGADGFGTGTNLGFDGGSLAGTLDLSVPDDVLSYGGAPTLPLGVDLNDNIPLALSGGGTFHSAVPRQTLEPLGGGNSRGARPLPKHKQPDRRIRLVPKNKGTLSGLLSPLKPTDGMLFPYTPIMQFSRVAEWNPYDLVHTNYRTQTYSKSYVDDITISAQFTSDTPETAVYSFAAAHFLKTMMQMYYGIQNRDRGAPPPVLELYGHGADIMNAVPVVIKHFSQEYNDAVDMIKVPLNGVDAWVPIIQSFVITLGVTHDMLKVRDDFSVLKFKNGDMIKRGYL